MPQPDYRGAYDFVKKNIKDGDLVLSQYAAITRVFLQRDYLWLSQISFETGEDYYTGLTAVSKLEDLKKMVETSDGFILLMGERQESQKTEKIKFIEENLGLQYVSFFDFPYEKISIYRF